MPVNDDAESRYVKSPPVTKSKRFDTPLSDLKNVANSSLFTAKDKTDIITEKGVYTLHANKKQRCSLYHNDHFLPTNIANDLLSHVIKTKSHINQPDGSINNNSIQAGILDFAPPCQYGIPRRAQGVANISKVMAECATTSSVGSNHHFATMSPQ